MRGWRRVEPARVGRILAGGLLAASLASCGGDGNPAGGSGPSPSPTPTPVSYTGTYTGTMTFTSAAGQGPVSASVAVTHTGANVSFDGLDVTSPFTGSYGMGDAVLSGNTFANTNSYPSQGCGVVTSAYNGYFSGDGGIMNLTLKLTPSTYNDNCFDIDVRGELSR